MEKIMENKKNEVKAYIQKHIRIEDIVMLISLSLGANKNYELDQGKNFDATAPLDKNNYAILRSEEVRENMDFYLNKKGDAFAMIRDPASNIHGVKISSKPFSEILKGEALCVEFGNPDSISIALAAKLVDAFGGVVSLNNIAIHKCSNSKAKLSLMSKAQMKKAEDGDLSSDYFYYKEKDVLRDAKALDWSFVEKLHKANPELDDTRDAEKRLKNLKEFLVSYVENEQETKRVTIKRREPR